MYDVRFKIYKFVWIMDFPCTRFSVVRISLIQVILLSRLDFWPSRLWRSDGFPNQLYSFMILLYKYTVYIFSSFRIALFVRTGLSYSTSYVKKSLDERLYSFKKNLNVLGCLCYNCATNKIQRELCLRYCAMHKI